MKNTIIKLLNLLTVTERFRAFGLILLFVIMALLDAISVASIMPFMMVISNPTLIESHSVLSKIYLYFNFTERETFTLFLGGAVLTTFIISMCFKIFTTYHQSHFILTLEYTLGERLIKQYLDQPYSWFLTRNSSELSKNLLSEINLIIGGVITPLMNLITQIFAALTILTLVFLANHKLAIIVFITLGTSYWIVHLLINKNIRTIGEKRFFDNTKRYQVVAEAFNAIKDIKISNLESIYLEHFSVFSKSYVKNHTTFQIISNIPRFVLETIAIGGMILVMLYLLSGYKGMENALPVVALYGMAGYRLMPAFQQIYGSVVTLTFSKPALNSLYSDYMGTKQDAPINSSIQEFGSIKQKIDLNNVTFFYPGTTQPALRDVKIEFPANKTIGIVGSSGSGKSTIIDLTLGLLKPNQGVVEVDGINLNKLNTSEWYKRIGYVPQNIMLIDNTLAANIAFGVDPKFVDKASLDRAARIANLHHFIHKLPMAYETMVGEHGIRLSGGERQRIAIARALYHNPQLLVFDEATSALDRITEKAVMEAVNNLKNKLTLIIVAHRLETVRQCHLIYHVDGGQIISSGTYDELIRIDPTFKSMSK